MLGACNTCVRLQSRVTSSGATVDGKFLLLLLFLLLLFVYLFVFLLVVVSFVCFFLFFFIYFVIRDGLGTKDWVFRGGWGDVGMGVVALIRKNTGVLGGAGHYNLCWPEYLGGFLIFRCGVGRREVATSWCGKINWVVIRIKLCRSDAVNTPNAAGKSFFWIIIFLNLLISVFIHLHLFIHWYFYLFIDIFISEWVL